MLGAHALDVFLELIGLCSCVYHLAQRYFHKKKKSRPSITKRRIEITKLQQQPKRKQEDAKVRNFSCANHLTLQDAINLWIEKNKNTVRVKSISHAVSVQKLL